MSLIQIKGLSKSFGDRPALRNINMSLEDGERAAIIGSTGAGKSTLLRTIEFLERPDSGEIFIDGESIMGSSDINRIRQKMSLIDSNTRLFSHMNVLENLCLAPVKLLGMSHRDSQRMARELLAKIGLTLKAQVMPSRLSGGQEMRIAICRSLMMSPKILLLDDPARDLDPAMGGEVLAMLRMLSKQGVSMLLVTNELDFIRENVDRVIFMSDGEILEEGTVRDVLDAPKHERTIEFIRKLRLFSFHIDTCDFDLLELQSGLRAFSKRYGLRDILAYRLQLCCEELIYEMLFGACIHSESISLDLEVSYDGATYIDVHAQGSEFNPFTGDDENVHLGITMLKQVARRIDYSYSDGTNHVSVIL